MQGYAAARTEQELELHRDNADDGLDGHVRCRRAGGVVYPAMRHLICAKAVMAREHFVMLAALRTERVK
ncbi:hypothetical protein GUJ93_ZPchr0013g37712 [Zizania palustris]|uniref:Uncharacterized protein n=1 Tax=Zizania palustris TaxID=103762 RepID=A0A8J5X119_ZIZPA|nr:hypothetical protein GUJ93_ZPchr0013g37712 [Zizania palustris]